MPHDCSFATRLLAIATLTLALLTAAVLDGRPASAQPHPSSSPTLPVLLGISPLQVQAAGTEATVRFTTSVPTVITSRVQPVVATAPPPPSAPSPAPQPRLPTPLTTGSTTLADAIPQGPYQTQHQLALQGLTSNTSYHVVVTATTQAGEQLRAETRFRTQNKRISITLEAIDIEDDGDLIGKGEPFWFVRATWSDRPTDWVQGCYPYDRAGRACALDVSRGEGRFVPRNSQGELLRFVFAEENFDHFPETVTLKVWASETDSIDILPRIVDCIAKAVAGGCIMGEEAPTVWRVPRGVAYAAQHVKVLGVDTRTGFESVLTFRMEVFHDETAYPTPRRNLPSSNWHQ